MNNETCCRCSLPTTEPSSKCPGPKHSLPNLEYMAPDLQFGKWDPTPDVAGCVGEDWFAAFDYDAGSRARVDENGSGFIVEHDGSSFVFSSIVQLHLDHESDQRIEALLHAAKVHFVRGELPVAIHHWPEGVGDGFQATVYHPWFSGFGQHWSSGPDRVAAFEKLVRDVECDGFVNVKLIKPRGIL